MTSSIPAVEAAMKEMKDTGVVSTSNILEQRNAQEALESMHEAMLEGKNGQYNEAHAKLEGAVADISQALKIAVNNGVGAPA